MAVVKDYLNPSSGPKFGPWKDPLEVGTSSVGTSLKIFWDLNPALALALELASGLRLSFNDV